MNAARFAWTTCAQAPTRPVSQTASPACNAARHNLFLTRTHNHVNTKPFARSSVPIIIMALGDSMTSFRPTAIEQLVIEAKLNLLFGATVYDRLFLGFEVLEVNKDELRAWASSEHRAAVIEVRHSGKVAWIAQTVFKRPIRQVSVLLRGMRHDTCEQPRLRDRWGAQWHTWTPRGSPVNGRCSGRRT